MTTHSTLNRHIVLGAGSLKMGMFYKKPSCCYDSRPYCLTADCSD